MQANFIDAYLFGPETALDAAAASMQRAWRRKCSTQEGDVVSAVYRYEEPQQWRLPPHRCVSLVIGSNWEGAEAIQKFCLQLGRRLTRDTALTAAFVSAEWGEAEQVQVVAVGQATHHAEAIAGTSILKHLRAKSKKTKDTLDTFMENDMLGPGALDLLANTPHFRSVFAHSLAAETALALEETSPAAGGAKRRRARM